MEPYNGSVAIEELKDNIKCTILCTSDPYAVVGIMNAFKMKPDLVSGIATNTEAGIDLIQKLTDIKALNLLDKSSLVDLNKLLRKKLKY